MTRQHLFAALLGTTALPTTAVACDIALLLAFDVSGSVDADEYRLQLDGLAGALSDPAVAEALVVHKTAVSVMQWTGTSRQIISIPWRHIEDFEDVDRLAEEVAQIERGWRNFSTAIGEAMKLGLGSFAQVAECERHIMDISADGVSNEGILPADVWPQLLGAGVTVNGLAIESDVEDLTGYFRTSVIAGPGAFAINATNYQDYPRAIRQKLLREITLQTASYAEP